MKSKWDRIKKILECMVEPGIILIILVGIPLIFKVRFLSVLGVLVVIGMLEARIIYSGIETSDSYYVFSKWGVIVTYVVSPAVAILIGILVGKRSTVCAGIWAADGTLLLLWFFKALRYLPELWNGVGEKAYAKAKMKREEEYEKAKIKREKENARLLKKLEKERRKGA